LTQHTRGGRTKNCGAATKRSDALARRRVIDPAIRNIFDTFLLYQMIIGIAYGSRCRFLLME
jgi:hypothetical protein